VGEMARLGGMKGDDLIRLQVGEDGSFLWRQRTNQTLHTDIGDQSMLHAPSN
jgi:hypothetical protein